MKIQCNVCDAAEANVLCCADEAALCWDCDRKVHAANKLASKHQRVPLSSSSSQMPFCDICREAIGYFFCLEDRALLCRKCDVAVHTANPLVSAHQRFLLTGIKVSDEKMSSHSNENGIVQDPRKSASSYPESQSNELEGLSSSSRQTFPRDSVTGNVSQWSLDEFLALGDHNPNLYIFDNASAKSDNGKLGEGDSDNSQRVADGEIGSHDCEGHFPDFYCAVPQIPSPITASGLRSFSGSVFVPDTGSSLLWDSSNRLNLPRGSSSKRRRNM